MALQDEADLGFFALTLWREARGESREGKIAVAHVIMNRIASPTWGNSMMSVLFQRLQFTSLTHASDPQLSVWPKDADPSWQECLEVASGVLEETIPSNVEKADSYHDISIQPPSWATTQAFVKQIGRIKFYRVGR
jgi:spore germination cell wall hydrolase CwlJ-like protein